MGKFILTIILFLITACCCLAQDLVLSDVIREAREAQAKQEAMHKAEQAMMQPIKNTATASAGEKSACEKINAGESFTQTPPVTQ